ncbi:hypothetical protein JM654_15225 [Microbacterium oxydans]|nr:hypothetical protein [Microbacterium oxydans]
MRQALNHAIDGEAIVQNIYGGNGAQSQQIFNPDSPAFVGDLDDAYPYDPEKAKELLADAGLPRRLRDHDARGQGRSDTALHHAAARRRRHQGDLGQGGLREPGGRSAGRQVRDRLLRIELGAPVARHLQDGLPGRRLEPAAHDDTGAGRTLAEVQASTGEAQTAAYQAVNEYITENAWFGIWLFTSVIQLTDAGTATQMQLGSNVPYLSSYAPAK